MSVSPATRERLSEIRERTREARAARKTAQDGLAAARAVKDAHAEAVAQMTTDRAQYDVEVAEQLERVLLGQMAGIGGGFDASSFLDDPEAVATLERLASTSQPVGRVELGSLMSTEAMCSMLNSGDWGQPKLFAASTLPDATVGRRGPFSELGVIPQPRRRLRLLDLIPSSPAVGNTVPYVIESGSLDTAAETAESALKPTGDIGLTDGEAPIRTVAHFIKSPRQILADVPGLSQVLQNRLTYAVLRRLESQIVNGDGTGQNLRGILNTSGIGAVAYSAGTPLGDLSLQGLVAVLNSEAEPDAAVMNATTLQGLLTPKASGSGEYLNIDSPFGTAPAQLTLWGIPTVISTMMPTGQVLFGSFGEGAHVWLREAVNVIVGLDSDDLTRNRVTLLGEMRGGVTINVPSFFTLVHLA